MRRNLALILVLILAGCGGGRHSAASSGDRGAPAPAKTAGNLQLALNAEQDGGEWRVNLEAPEATDLYQIAGTLDYDADRYDVVAVEAGGGLGQPDNSYFVSSEKQPGRIGFAYTKRYFGPGVNGDAWLVSVRVTPRGEFNLADFKLDTDGGKLLARDSRKQPFAVNLAVAP